MIKLILTAFFSVLIVDVFAQAYDVSLISKDMLPRASAVVRNKEMHLEVKDLKNVTFREKIATTILNSNGDVHANIYIWYNKTQQIKSIKGTIYNEFGMAVSKFSEKNFSDVSAANDFSLFEDSRMKRFISSVNTYPYTIEYEYEVKAKQSLIFPEWHPVPATGVAVENSVFRFISGTDFHIQYKELNYPGKATIDDLNGQKTYTWQVKNLKAIRDEPYSPDPEKFMTSVKIAPEKFSYQDISGSFSNWDEYGKWMYNSLLKDRDLIPEETTVFIQNLVKDIEDPKLKAKKIYEYMQNKTRYISVQVGIGGYQPILASEVDKFSYGDCKGLVNYTRGLLKIAGIESYYTVVNAGNLKQDLLPDFASMNQGNHVILCIPFKNDTTWLECTSKNNPFGFLGAFTDDRLVIACTPEGGKLLRTPKLKFNENLQFRKARFNIDSAGNLTGTMHTNFEGAQYDNREELIGLAYTEQVKKLQDTYNIPNLFIESFSIKQNKTTQPVTIEEVKFQALNYAVLNGNSLYIPLNAVNQINKPLRDIQNRTSQLYLNRGYTDIDEITFTFPANYRIDLPPKNINIVNPAGTYSVNLDIKDNQCVYKRKIELKDGTYAVGDYEKFVRFYQTIIEADDTRLMLIKKN